MKYINKLRNFSIPFDYPKFAIVISIAALGFAASTHNTPCLSAQSTCSVGSDNEFTGNISLKGGTPNLATFDASGITADRTLTIPNNTGTLALTSDIPAASSYTPNAPFLKADGTGAAISGTATADAPFVSINASGQLDSSATLTADSPFLSADASGQIAAGGSLTASTPLKSSATGQIAASDLDITTDITPGSALQEIRTNAAGNALEYFTPSGGGGRWSLVAQGQAEHYYGDMTICWYDDTQGTGIGGGLDQTKVYKLVVEPTLPFQASFYPNNSSYPAMVPMADTSCSTMPSSSNYLFNSSVTNNGLWATNYYGWQTSGSVYNAPWLGYQQGTTANSSSNRCGGASIEMTMRNGIDLNGGSANTLNQGIKVDVSAHAPCFNTLDITGFQAQDSRGLFFDSLQAPSTPGVNNMNQFNGVMLKRYDMQSGAGAGTPPVWYLYEATH